MMKKPICKKGCLACLGAFLLFLVAGLGSCKDEEISSSGYDPSRPVVFTGFSPEEGSLRTQIHIYGENFGTDPSKIHITIGGQFTTTIGCTDNEIYCMVPPKAFDGDIKVTIESADGNAEPFEYEFEKRFVYVSQTSVGTLVGSEDENGNSSDVDADNFEDARFGNIEWLLLDTFGIEKCLIVSAKGGPVRRVNLETEEVSTLITNGQGGFNNMQYMSFDSQGDTLFISDDHGQNNKDRREIAYFLRSEDFRKPHPYVYDRTGYCNAYCEKNHSLYYNTYWKGALQRAVDDPATGSKVGREIFGVYNADFGTYMAIHPDGRYMYITGRNCIMVSRYSDESQEFQSVTSFAGREGEGGFISSSPGTQARFQEPYQGTFVRNEEYVTRPDGNMYDYYICDKGNHCIFKITPDGNVSLYAGRGSVSSDGQVNGLVDGDLRRDARFDEPCGIAYDEEEKVFYIADKANHRIRTISVE